MKPIPYRTFILLACVFLIIIVPFCFFGEAVDAWTTRLLKHADAYPLQTGSLLTLLLAVDILIPVPSSLVSTACGMTLGFLGGTCASFTGMTLSAAAGLLLGRYAAPAAQRLIGQNERAWLRSFHNRHGVWLLLALRPVPVLAEASVVFSGLARQPLPQALAVTALGNAAVSAAYAAVGVWGRLSDSFLPAFGASMLLSGVLLAVSRLKRKAASPPHHPAA
ncbi:MAG: VTT domain-containing protein [Kiritimatiellae bacterium]|nr:VTT domain-containing protein [Kiritimatiellia bacterium]